MTAIDLRCGRWQDVLADVTCDVLITDPPYSARTHEGHNGAVVTKGVTRMDRGKERRETGVGRKSLVYTPMTSDDVYDFVSFWVPRTRGWFVVMTDHVLVRAWEDVLLVADRYVFSPLHFIAPGSRVRLFGDGPANWSVTIVVARPKSRAFARWGALPGGYVLPGGHNDRCNDHESVTGGKPLWLMRALVRDYSRPGDLICDPCAGGATTLLAAAIEGRRAVGSEMDPDTHAKAMKRIARGYTPTFDFAREGT